MTAREAATNPSDVDRLRKQLAETTRQVRGYQQECREVEQVLGAALGYPWFKDDQVNFPGTTKADGVCVGEHGPSTIADEAARHLRAAKQIIEDLLPYAIPTIGLPRAIWPADSVILAAEKFIT